MTKLNASNGAVIGTFPVGTSPYDIAFDGTNMWVSNFGSNTVTKLSGVNGSSLGTFTTGAKPYGVVYDGANIWVANSGDNTITKPRVDTGKTWARSG